MKLKHASIAALMMLSSSAMAATITTTFPVSAEIAATCNTVAATALDFGQYDPISGSVKDATSEIDVTCTTGTSFQIYLNGGLNGNITQRKLKADNSTDTLNYNLYTDAGHSTVWGDNSTGTPVADTGTGSAVKKYVYGRIDASQASSSSDTYQDTITVTVDY